MTKLNIDAVDDWVVRANTIYDGHKNGGDNVSYQSFMKGGGKNGLYERNLVICTKNETSGGMRIGLSFGGGGTGAEFCAPAFDANTPCNVEQYGGTMRNNIIVQCSDVGIYLNRAKDTKLLFNTLVATNGVDFRYATTSGEADGNVLASVLRLRDGAAMTKKTNLENVADTDFASWYQAPLLGDLRNKGDLSAIIGKASARADVTDDYCARTRTGAYDLGALQASLGDCATAPDGGTGPGGGVGGSGDGGAPGGPGTDAGAAPSTAGDTSGCACTSSSRGRGTSSLAAAFALALALAIRRQERRRGSSSGGRGAPRSADRTPAMGAVRRERRRASSIRGCSPTAYASNSKSG